MSKQTEDTMYEIHTELTQSKLWSKFNTQLKKMESQKNINGKLLVKDGSMLYNKLKKSNGSNFRKIRNTY